MQQFITAHAVGGDADGLLAQCLAQLSPVPAASSLGFIYATAAAAQQLPAILDGLKEYTPGVEWLGCSGEGICSGGVETYDEAALSLLLTDIPPQQFCCLSASEDLFVQLPDSVTQWCRQHPDCFGLLHAVPTYMATNTYVKAIRQLAPQAHLNGGMSSGSGNYRHIENGVLEHGISGVLFSRSQTILSGHSQGCTPISETFSVDETHQNMVLQLGGRPALQVLRQSVGEVLWRDPQRLGNYIFVGLPTEEAPGGAPDGDYMVRNLLGLDPEADAIAVGDLMEHHKQLHFCRRDGNAAHQGMVEMLQRLKSEVGGRTIRGGIYISCVGRGRRQFGGNSEELKLIGEQLGEFPLAGFFANGEFYGGHLYSYTGVLTLFL